MLVLIEAGYLQQEFLSGLVLVTFALAASCALLGLNSLVDALEADKGRTRMARALLSGAIGLLGIGVGLLIALVL